MTYQDDEAVLRRAAEILREMNQAGIRPHGKVTVDLWFYGDRMSDDDFTALLGMYGLPDKISRDGHARWYVGGGPHKSPMIRCLDFLQPEEPSPPSTQERPVVAAWREQYEAGLQQLHEDMESLAVDAEIEQRAADEQEGY